VKREVFKHISSIFTEHKTWKW